MILLKGFFHDLTLLSKAYQAMLRSQSEDLPKGLYPGLDKRDLDGFSPPA
jgi:hypothetical protein